ncbi:NADH dehydrogenase [ubiquinone] 1 beta subcomplex subunit 1 isoform X1 [Crotalus tigris]|uniref:NADH dehydrogenase [ubiquinone] 1 beta subcomplex subunit 1 isoform X1 n=1 Tax=Crotalus tigris TaxID=88082 RepID=UPI00192FB1A4|nr:NADH dehydrogenase [ubiquinone] 1 beta subcomplex subunit 1 isoform X1 [Crotalus tigris]
MCHVSSHIPWKIWSFYRLTTMNVIHLVRDHWPLALCPLGFLVGWYFDKKNDEKMAIFRNKSKLYQRELKPGEDAIWK